MLCERYVSREQWLRVKICHSCKGVKSRLKALQAGAATSRNYCRPEIVKKVLLY